jgi:hypothetical protein
MVNTVLSKLVAVLLMAVAGLLTVVAQADEPAAQAEQPAAQSGQPAAKLADFKRWVIAADIVPGTGQIVTAGGESLLYRPGDVVVWNPDGSRVGDLAGHPTAVWAVQVAADGKLAATAGYDGLIKLWDLPGRTLKHDLKKHKGWVRSLAFSPDGARLASAGEDGTVVIWDTATGAEQKTIAAHAGPVTCVAFSRDGATLATGGGDKLVKLWNPADGAEKGKLEGHGDALWAVAYSPDGARLATAGADRTVRLWTTSDGTPEATLSGHKDWVTSVGFSPDGMRLVSGSLDGAVKLWDVAAKGEQEGPAALKSSVWTVRFTPDATSILVGSHAGPSLVATPAAKLLPPPPPPPPPPPQPVNVTVVPKAFSSAAGSTGAIAADGTVTVTGPLAKDTYTLQAEAPPGAPAVAVRLDALADPSLPAQGPGRAGNGNFVLSTFGVKFGPPGGAEAPTAVAFKSAKASFEQGGFGAANAIDDKSETGWAISGGIGKDQSVTFEIPADVKIPAGAPLVITLDQQHADGTHALGRFRITFIQPPPTQP